MKMGSRKVSSGPNLAYLVGGRIHRSPTRRWESKKVEKSTKNFSSTGRRGGPPPPSPTLVCQNVKNFFVDFLRFDDSYHVFGCRGICGAKI